jgi:endonuclease-3
MNPTRKATTRKPAPKRARKKSAPRSKTVSRKPKRRRARPGAERVSTVLDILARHDPDPKCALDHANAYELLAATILSAQCTDVRVNLVTPALFARYPTPNDLGSAKQEDVEELVRTTGFFRNKAKNLIGMGRRVADVFGGEVPRGMDELLSLPGVARKTANVVRGESYRLADGVVVDTHVARITARLGFTLETDPVQIERNLMQLVPQEQWIAFSHRIIRFGRSICDARKPRCDICPLAEHCPKKGVKPPR